MTQIALSHSKCSARAGNRSKLWQLLGLARQRRALTRLDDRALEDIGLTRREADIESARPIWDAPDNWVKQL